MKPKFSSVDIAQALQKFDAKVHQPTDEQKAIIESLHFAPTIVIAGAGSGKTETMAARVLWLVANGYAKPEEILGLTFTNKAASELNARIRKRLRQLSKSGLVSRELAGNSCDVFTYHAYAGRILQEDGVRIGLDVAAEPMGDAAVWQLARDVLYRGAAFSESLESKPASLVNQLIELSDSLIEHGKSVNEVKAHTESQLEMFANTIPSRGSDLPKDVIKVINILKLRLELLDRVEVYLAEKRKRGWYTFNDQMNLAADLVAGESVHAAEIGERERKKYKFVILDEYQDTSPNQTRFLSAIFKNGYPITAVGDPNQAIYEWRGAGAETLNDFPHKFGGKCEKYTLLTSWRNDQSILELANELIVDIDAKREEIAMQRIEVSGLKASSRANKGLVEYGRYFTYEAECAAIADKIEELWKLDRGPDSLQKQQNQEGAKLEGQKSFAILVRTKSLIPAIEAELSNRNIPVEIVGFDGLIHLPEIADLLAMARIVFTPDSGSDFMRFATGPYLNLGAKDLAALGRFLSQLAKSETPSLSRAITAKLADVDFDSVDPAEFYTGSVIEALENIEECDPKLFSEAGYLRLCEFAQSVRKLRRMNYSSITDLLLEIVRHLNLDIEIQVRDGVNSRKRYLDNFLNEAARFARTGGNIFDFLSWIDVTEKEERGLKPTSTEVDPSKVQILTIHSAKGLEWDYVFVPGLAVDRFPNKIKSYDLWLTSAGALPTELRRDRDLYREFAYPPDRKSARVNEAIEEIKGYWKKRKILEEYRLAYVAFTRAKEYLGLSSAFFYADESKPKAPSTLATLVTEQEVTQEVYEYLLEPDYEELREVKIGQWPIKREIVRERKGESEKVLAAKPFTSDELSAYPHLQALIKEFLERNNDIEVTLPGHLSVSQMIMLWQNSEEFASQLRRPMPHSIDPYSKRGTAFHLWVERYFESATLFSDDELNFSQRDSEDEDLEVLKTKWLSSKYAKLQPVEVEMPFDLSIGKLVLRGRIDAVYQEGEKFRIVDWKTGKSKSAAELKTLSLQLATYKLAFHKLKGVPLSKIDAEFFYLGDEKIVIGEDLATEEDLLKLLDI